MKKLLLVLAVAAVAVPAASAGGWATVGLSSLPPAGLGPEETWPVDITVLQHGQTPLAGVTPIVRIRDDGGKVVDSFTATPTGKTGVYHADVTLPRRGHVLVRGLRRLHDLRRRADAHVQAGRDRRRRRRPALRLGRRSRSVAGLALAAGTVLALRRRDARPRSRST